MPRPPTATSPSRTGRSAPVRSKDTSGKGGAPAARAAERNAAASKLAADNGCMACHGTASKIVGPGYNEVAAKYKARPTPRQARRQAQGRRPGRGGAIPMPPQTQLKDGDARRLVKWILSGAKGAVNPDHPRRETHEPAAP